MANRLLTWIGMGGLMAACQRAPTPPPAAHPTPSAMSAGTVRGAPEAPQVLAVARNIEVYEAPWGSPHVASVADADVLEWREDGFVRIRADGGVVEGYSVLLLNRPEVGRGVGL